MVVYGRKWSGKTFAANRILGEEIFHLSESINNRVGMAEVAGRWRVQLVLTPGWWKPFLPNETMELVKLKMIQGVAQCGPAGPHALLLVIDTDTQMDEKSVQATEKHLELLGREEVWKYAIVVLNAGIWHDGDPTAPEYISQSGGFLGQIVRKCGGRFHLLNMDKTHPKQVLRLLEKVERMLDDNGGEAFRVDAALALSTETRLREVMEKVALRQATVPAKRELLREMYKGVFLSACPSLSVSVPVWLSVHPSILLPLSIYLSIHLLIHQSMHLSIQPSLHSCINSVPNQLSPSFHGLHQTINSQRSVCS